jgi:hypothetical protein
VVRVVKGGRRSSGRARDTDRRPGGGCRRSPSANPRSRRCAPRVARTSPPKSLRKIAIWRDR